MFDQLERYLLSVIPYERVDVLLDSCKTLIDCSQISFESDIEEILLTLDNYNNTDNVASIETVLRNNLVSVLKSFTIQLVDNTPLEIFNSVIRTMLVVGEYGDKDYILSILQSDISKEEKLVEIVSAISSLEWEELIVYVKEVDEDLLNKMVKVLGEPEESEFEDLSFIRERFTKYKNANPEILAMQLLNEGLKLGSPMVKIIPKVFDDLELLDRKPVSLATEVVGLVLLSDTPVDQITETVKNLLTDFSKDININTQAYLAAIKLLGDNS